MGLELRVPQFGLEQQTRFHNVKRVGTHRNWA